MRSLIFAAVVGAVTAVTAHAQSQTVSFEGMLLAGDTADAKASGFRECRAIVGFGYGCSTGKPIRVFGVLAMASVGLRYPDYVPLDKRGTFPVEGLRYDGITLMVGMTGYHDECVRAKQKSLLAPALECRKSDEGSDFLEMQLKQAGWVEVGTRQNVLSYVHPSSSARFTWFVHGKAVDLEPTSPRDRDDALARAADTRARLGLAQKQDERLRQLMK